MEFRGAIAGGTEHSAICTALTTGVFGDAFASSDE
jgi:hypothetical protein